MISISEIDELIKDYEYMARSQYLSDETKKTYELYAKAYKLLIADRKEV